MLLLNTSAVVELMGEPSRHPASAAHNLTQLVQDIQKNGIQTPVQLRRMSNGQLVLVGGYRRVAAAILCGFRKIPCEILDYSPTSK